jgi:hypothetical protein
LLRCFVSRLLAFQSYGVPELIRNAGAGSAGTKDDDTQIADLIASHMDTSSYCGEGDAPRALDVVVEAS